MAKQIAIKYPRGAKFTILDVISLNVALNAQTVRNYIRKAIAQAELNIIGTQKGEGRGRPAFLLARAS